MDARRPLRGGDLLRLGGSANETSTRISHVSNPAPPGSRVPARRVTSSPLWESLTGQGFSAIVDVSDLRASTRSIFTPSAQRRIFREISTGSGSSSPLLLLLRDFHR